MKFVQILRKALWANKWRILLTLLLVPVFVILLFPTDDVGDLVTTEVGKATHNQVYLQFNHMNLSFLPQPGVSFDDFSVETAQMPPLSIRRLEVNPSLMGLLLRKIDVSASAEGIFRGDVKVSVRPGRKLENGAQTQSLNIQAERVSLGDLRQFAGLPVQLRGQLNLSAEGQIDPSFSTQPDITLNLQSPNFELQPSSVETLMGPLTLPDLKLGQLQLKGRLSAGQFLIEEGVFGRPGDDLVGNIKGTLSLEMRNLGGRIQPVATNYEFRIDMTAKKAFEDRSRLFLMLIEGHRQPEGDGGRYRFVLRGNASAGQFNFSAMQ